MLVLCNDGDFVLRVPVEGFQNDMVAARRETDFRLPVGRLFLQKSGRRGVREGENRSMSTMGLGTVSEA